MTAPTPMAAPTGTNAQPITAVRWVHRDDLTANRWNPNKQAPPEHRLLKLSILENGWTQPIVVRPEEGGMEIVDGYHRWTVSADADVHALTDGLVPVVELPHTDPATARMSTIRHNRARGTHHVLGMADNVAELINLGITPDEIGRRLEMDPEEVERLSDRGDMLHRHNQAGFNNGWSV